MKASFPIILLLFPLCSWAGLGGNGASVISDGQALQAKVQSSASTLYTVTILQLQSGTVVKEYADNATGTVFGIAWQGPLMPNLRQLLGAYFDAYLKGLHAGTGPGYVDTPDLVVRSDGHMRAFSGHAYIPNLLPPGVLPADIK